MSNLDDVGAQFREMPWVQFLGIEMTDAEPGRVTLRIDPKEEHHNQNGTVNAPVIFGLAESAGAAALVMGFLELLGTTYSVVRRVEMEFLAAARGPITATGVLAPQRVEEASSLVAAGEPVDVPVPVEVHDGDGRVVARLEMVMAVRAPRADG